KELTLLLKEVCITPYVKEKRRAILLEGETGAGKTSLCKVILNHLKYLENYCFFESTGEPVEKHTPYFAWRKVFESIFLLNADNGFGSSEMKITSKMELLCPELIKYIPLLSSVVGVDIPENNFTRQLEGKRRMDKMNQLLITILQRVTRNKTYILVFDDFHYFDNASVELLKQFLVCDKKSPLLLILCYKPT